MNHIREIDTAASQPTSGETKKEVVANASVHRGVTVELLLQFTLHHDCWEWKTRDVIYKLIKLYTV